MAQWPPFPPLPPMAAKPQPQMQIPEEWEKANAALQAVIPHNKENKSDPPVPTQDTNGNAGNFPWQNQQMYPPSYPGYPGYPVGYSYYNYNFHCMMNNNNGYFPMPPQMRPPAPPSPAGGKDSKMPPGAVLSQPPPPPPPSPPASTFFTNITSQAPGSGGIKFNLPKKKNNKKNGFIAAREAMQERLNSFRAASGNPQNHNQDNQKNLSAQKVSSMSDDSWPPSLKTYVAKCFDKCKTALDKDQVEILLKGKLIKAKCDGTLMTKDWENEPLPSTHSDRLETEQKQQTEQTQSIMKKLPDILKMQGRSPNSLKNAKSVFQNNRVSNHHSRSRSRSRSYSRSRSRSRTPPPPSSSRKVIRRRRYSSSSSESSEDSRGSRKASLSSSIISPSDMRFKITQNNKNKKKKKKPFKTSPFTIDSSFSTDERLIKRAARFENKSSKSPKATNIFNLSNSFVIDETGDDIEWNSDAVMGTCIDLEKPFLRLTGAVDPSTVRPEEVLIQSLNMVKKHWSEKQDYHFACEQLKSIRQDLVVQCIRNKFTVEVYETHARIALEKGDHTEFNQCQSQLKVLFLEVNEGNRLEFTGYHILYAMYTENDIELKNILTDLSAVEKRDDVVRHALSIANACSSNNFCRFFKLYLQSPKMSGFIIDWFIDRIRKAALKTMIKSFRPNLPVSHIESALAFPSSEVCLAYLAKANLVYVDAAVINCKESMGALANF